MTLETSICLDEDIKEVEIKVVDDGKAIEIHYSFSGILLKTDDYDKEQNL